MRIKRYYRQVLFSKKKSNYRFISTKKLVKEYPELLVLKRIEEDLIELDLRLTSAMLIVCENHPFTLIEDKDAKRLIKERWLPKYLRPVIFGLDIDSNLVMDLRTNKFYIYNIDQPKKPKLEINSLDEYIKFVLEILRIWAKETGRMSKNVIKVINAYKNILHKELNKI